MRSFAVALSGLLLLLLPGCGAPDASIDEPAGPQLIPPNGSAGAGPGTTPSGGATTPGGTTATPAVDADLQEVVYVIINDWNGGTGFCTGTLVAKDIVLTAGHCVDTNIMNGFEVVAARAPNKPRVTASRVARFDGDYDDPANPDIGLLRLDEPIVLPHYAQMTDVSTIVDGGQKVDAIAVIRTAEEAEAPLKHSGVLEVSSAKGFGYQHGFHTPMFSIGGDSGAGLFLLENGKRTHKLIGVARQPEPERDVDHFTRIDATITKWFAEAKDADE